MSRWQPAAHRVGFAERRGRRVCGVSRVRVVASDKHRLLWKNPAAGGRGSDPDADVSNHGAAQWIALCLLRFIALAIRSTVRAEDLSPRAGLSSCEIRVSCRIRDRRAVAPPGGLGLDPFSVRGFDPAPLVRCRFLCAAVVLVSRTLAPVDAGPAG